MRKYSTLILLFIAIALLYACNNDFSSDNDEIEITDEEQCSIIVNPIFINNDSILSNCIDFASMGNKKYGDGKYSFIYGGNIKIGRNTYETIIVGNQRWTSEHVETNTIGGFLYPVIDDELESDIEPNMYYDLLARMKFANTKIVNSYSPNNLIEKSSWRIPTYDDAHKLWENIKCNSRYEKYHLITSNLNYAPTGWYSIFHNAIIDSEHDYFWLSDTTQEENKESLTYFALVFNDKFYGAYPFQVPIEEVFMPIRLVQDIIPIEDVD